MSVRTVMALALLSSAPLVRVAHGCHYDDIEVDLKWMPGTDGNNDTGGEGGKGAKAPIHS